MSSFQENTVTGVTKNIHYPMFSTKKKLIKNSKCIINVSSKSFSIQSTRNLIPRKPMKQHCSKILPSYAALCLQGVNI